MARGAPSARLYPTLAVLAMLVVSAFETTVVTTAMPSAVAELGDATLYPWVFIAFLVSSTASVLVAGRLADAYGRKPAFILATGVFVVGSLLAAGAWSVPALIAFRVVQGFGAGAVHPLAMTVTGDLYSLEERARIQGLLTATWGLANVAGPIVGSVLVAHASFRWAFVVAVPPALVALGLLVSSYDEPPRAARVAEGGTLRALGLGVVVAAALVAVDKAAARPFSVGARGAMLAAAAIGLVALVRAERRSEAPLLPRGFIDDPTARAAFVGSIASGGLFYATTTYATLWLTANGEGPHAAAQGLVGLLVGWATGSTGGVRLYVARGMRASAGLCLVLAAIALGLTAAAVRAPLPGLVPFTLFAAGLGLGPANSTALVGAQSRVGRSGRGMVTSGIFATRTFGGAVLVAALARVSGGAGGERAASETRFVVLTVVAACAAALMLTLPPKGKPEPLGAT